VTATDWKSAWETTLQLANGWVAGIEQARQANLAAATRSLELMTNTYTRLWGRPAKGLLPADRRFTDDAWKTNLAFDWIKQAYLTAAQWMVDVADGLEELDPAIHRRAVFWTRQVADALSPANFALTNPVVLQETIRTGGANLVQGMLHFLSDAQKGRISHVPEGSFKVGKNLAITPGKVVYRSPLIELIQYTPTTEHVRAGPILVIPPWINKYYVMDMRPDNSMFKYLVDAGFTLFVISWKNPDSSMRHLDWEDYMAQGPLDALRVVKAITGAEPVNMVGYCVGGLMLEVTLAYMAAVGDKTANTATYFATHQDFTDAGDLAAFISDPDVRFLEWLMDISGGYLDGRNMGATFSMLRANDLIWRYVVNSYLMGEEPRAFDLLYWNGDGTRVPERVHSFLLRNLYLENRLIEPDRLTVQGVGIDVRRITTPTYAVASLRDHIVPWKGAFRVRELMGGPVRFVLTEGGHVAGIINPPAEKKRSYWTNESKTTPRRAEDTADPEAWFANATEHQGSWWVDWIPWLEERSGEQITPPPMGSDEFPPLADAPGTYVLEE
jgi:polyhydroxyalkanoate synthase